MICLRLWILSFILGIAATTNAASQNLLTFEGISNYLRTGGTIATLHNRIRSEGVAFQLTTDQADSIRQTGAANYPAKDLDELIAIIKVYAHQGRVEIGCKPVDCEVWINAQRVGQTSRGGLTYRTSPGPIDIEVKADGYVSAADNAKVERDGVIQKEFVLDPKPAPTPVSPVTPLASLASPFSAPQPATGTLMIICEAGNIECLVQLDDGRSQVAVGKEARFTDVGMGPHNITLSARGFRSKSVLDVVVQQGEVATSGPHTLEPVANAASEFQRIMKAIGEETDPELRQAIQATGNSTINGTQMTFVESAWLPEWVRWDVSQAERKFVVNMVTRQRRESSVDGDPEIKNSTVTANLVRGFEALERLRVNRVLPYLRDNRHQISMPDTDERLLVATGTNGEVFRIAYDERFLPVRIEHEPPHAVFRTEVAYGHYASVGGWVLPFSATIRFSDDSAFMHEVQYTVYYLGADLRRDDIVRWKLKKPGIDMWFKKGRTKCFTELGEEEGGCKQ